MISFLLLLLLLQDSPVDKILQDFERDRARARDQAAYDKAVSTAVQALEEIVLKSPKGDDAPKAWSALGDFYNGLEQSEKAIRAYETVLNDHPKSTQVPHALLSLADIRLRQEKDKDAADLCEKFLKDHKDHDGAAYARLFLSMTKLYRGKNDEAIKDLVALKTDLKDKPLEWPVATQLAVTYHISGKQKEAQRTLEEIIRGSKNKQQVTQMRRLLTGYIGMGKEAPDLADVGYPLKKQRGKVLVLYFYYSYLPLSEGELGFLKTLREKTNARDVEIAGVSLDPKPSDFKGFKELNKIPWTLLYDGKRFDGPIARKYDVQDVPHLLVIDAKGVIRFFNVSGRDLRLAVGRLLKEKAEDE